MLVGSRPFVHFQGLQPSRPMLGQHLGTARDAVHFSAQPTAPRHGSKNPEVAAYLASFPRFGPPPFNAEFHADRRRQFLAQLPPNSTVIVPGAANVLRNGDVDHPFRQESNFYYLTGFDEPDSVAILSNVPGRPAFTLVVPPRDPARETWNGKRAGTEGALAKYGADQAFNNTDLDTVLADVAKHGGQVSVLPAVANPGLNARVQKAASVGGSTLQQFWQKLSTVFEALKQLHPAVAKVVSRLEERLAPLVSRLIPPAGQGFDPEAVINEMRLVKTPYEQALMRRACEISALSHINAMRRTQLSPAQVDAHPARAAGRNEGEIQAEVEHGFRRHGAVRNGYSSIAGGGANGCVLHYVTNTDFVKPGDLELVDAGAEYGYYTADVTRTWPISGKFTPEQKAIYDLVLKAQDSGIRMVRPGMTLKEIHENSVRVITQGLVDLGILKGDVDALIRDKAYFKYFMHGTSHMMGMDVHDVVPKQKTGETSRPGQTLPLRPGMVFSVEPGIYIDPQVGRQEGIDPKWWGIGVRIEDDILVTDDGYENLSEQAPRTTEAIEATMAKARGRVR